MNVSTPATDQDIRTYRQEFRSMTVRRKPRVQLDRRPRATCTKELAEWLGKGFLLDVQV